MLTITDTPQEAFDKVLAHFSQEGAQLSRQRKPGEWPANRDEGPACLYRHPDGHKCAFGVLIPDEQYNPAFEKTGAVAALVSNGLVSFKHEETESLCKEMQCWHDDAASVADLLLTMKAKSKDVENA